MQDAIGLKKWFVSCGSDYAKAVAKVVRFAEEHDALIARLKTPEARRQYRTELRRKRTAEECEREARSDAAYRRKLERLGIRDPDLEAEDALLQELTPQTWRYVPSFLQSIESAHYAELPTERESAQQARDFIERAGAAGHTDLKVTSAPVHRPDRDEFHDQLVGLYESAFGPSAEIPSDPMERDEFDLLKMKLERRIARIAPKVDTISAIFERYLEFSSAKPATQRKYREHVDSLITRIGDLPIQHVTPKLLREHRDFLATKLSASSVRASFTPISGLFAYAVDEGLIDISPVAGVRLPRDKRAIEEIRWLPFTPEEMTRILDQAKSSWLSPTPGLPRGRREALEMLVRVLAFTAMRPAEVMALKPEDVSEDSITIREGKTKSAWRVVPLHRKIRDFHGWMRNGGMEVFEGIKTDRVTPLRQNFAKLIRSHLDEPISEPRKALYSLRSTFQNAMRRAGAPEHVRRAILGHSEGGALRHYDDGPEFEMKKKWVELSDPRM